MQEHADLEDKIEIDLSKLFFIPDNLADFVAWSQKIVHWEHFPYWLAGNQGGVLLLKWTFLVQFVHNAVCSLEEQNFLGLFTFLILIVSPI